RGCSGRLPPPARIPRRFAWWAPPCAWSPADTARTPAARSAGASDRSLLRAPRSLNDAVNCRFSNLSQTLVPVISESVLDARHGVTSTAPAIARAASRTLWAVTIRTAPRRACVHPPGPRADTVAEPSQPEGIVG